MAETLVQSVQDMLKEETWTRTTITNYTEENLKKLAEIVEKAHSENCVDEVLAVCEEQLAHSKESIIALYLKGILSLQKGSLDNSVLETLVDMFKKNHKESLVVCLCSTILDDDESNKFALRTLADIYASDPDNKDKIWDLYTAIVKADTDEADLARILADYYDSVNDTDKAIEYYKKAILRYINIGNFNACKDIWSKLVKSIPSEIDFFNLVNRKIAKKFGEIKTTTLMQELYGWYKDNKKWDTAIEILKQNLTIEPNDTWARNEITYCYRNKYANHSRMEEYIRSSNLEQRYRNVFEAINDFEKHIAFDKGSYVFHRNWGVGIIRKLENDTLTIKFGSVGEKEMKLSMAVSALEPLAKDHIWVLKASYSKDELVKMVKGDEKTAVPDKVSKKTGKILWQNPGKPGKPEEKLTYFDMYGVKWTLKTIIKSFDNNCDFKRIKAELVPSILSAGEWTSWNASAKKILESDAAFGVNPNDISMYTVREHEISPEEKLSTEFRAQKQFFARIDILMKFYNSDETDKDSEFFKEMYSYFTGYLKNISKVNEQVIASFLIVQKLSGKDKRFAFQIPETFAELYSKLENPKETYDLLKDTKNTTLRTDFLEAIKMLPDWNVQYLNLFPIVLDKTLLDELISNGFTADVQKFVRTCFEGYKDYRETVLFLFKECQTEEWYKEAGVSYEKQLITIINIIELTFREINSHVNSTENKKINKNATLLLFKDGTIYDYIFADNDINTIKKFYTLIDDIADFDPTYKTALRNKIQVAYPEFKFRVSEEKVDQSKGMFVTNDKLVEKKAELERLQKDEIPANAKDIAEAREKGDLKENAEYKSAKEKQHMLNLSVAKLQEELNRAMVFDPSTVTGVVTAFGTVTVLHNNKTDKDEKYIILGPWESDPDNDIISYLSPFGSAILDKKVGQQFKFSVNGNENDYTVKEIKKATI